MKMSPLVETFVLHFGEMGGRWGVNRTVGQLYALLVLSREPMNADDLASYLGISRGNVSMGLKELQSWQLIKRVHIQGDRKEYFSAAGDFWDMGRKVIEERRKREIDPTLTVLRDILLDTPSNEHDIFAQEKIREIHDLLELVTDWSEELQKMQPEKVRTLMKLGSGVSKVLDIKEKLLHQNKRSE